MARTVDPDRIAQKRALIAREAGQLFARQGYDRTSVAQVARAAGTSSASVFYYFADKAALFRAVFEQDLPAAETLVARHADRTDPFPAILDVLDALAKDADDPNAVGLVIELLRRVELDPELVAVVEQTTEITRNGLAALIARGIAAGDIDPTLNPVDTAAWLQAIVDATYLDARPGHSSRPQLRRTATAYLAPARHRGGALS